MENASASDHALKSLTDIVKRAISETGDGSVSVDELMRSFGQTSFVPLLLLPALVLITPLSGIPGLSTFCGIIILLIAGQRLVGHEQIWLPGWIRQRSVKSAKLHDGLERLLPLTRFIDKLSRRRLTFLFHRPFHVILPLACVIFGVVMPMLEFVPFSSSLVGVAVTLIAFAMLTRDGLFALIALIPVGVVTWGIYAVLSSL